MPGFETRSRACRGKPARAARSATPIVRQVGKEQVKVRLLSTRPGSAAAGFSLSRSAGLLVCLAGAAFAAYAQPSPSIQLPTLTTARQAHSLSSEEAARGYPIHLRAVITYYDPSIGSRRASLFVHDATGAIYVELPEGAVRNLAPGMLLDVRGVSGRGEFAPIVARPQIKIIGHSDLPAHPPRVSLTQLKAGIDASEWVEAEGLVHSVTEYEHNVILQLAMEGGNITVVMVKQAGADYDQLVDAQVLVHANASQTFNNSHQMVGVRLMCPGLLAIKVVEAQSGDSFLQPVILVDKLLRWDQVKTALHRIHMRGTVTLQWPGRMLCIHDATHGICAQTAQETHAALGDEVDVVGFAGAEHGEPVLRDAVYRVRAGGSPVAAEKLTAAQALLGWHGSELVQVDGRLVGKDIQSSDATLLLTAGKNIFVAVLPSDAVGTAEDGWKIGSLVRITGVCAVQLDAQRSAIGEGMAVPQSFKIYMRSTGDVTVLHEPSWWTSAHALVLLALVLAGTLLVLAWVVALRKRVAQQTCLLRESEERFRHLALHDALTGLASRLLLQDRLNAAVQLVKRQRMGLALIMLDIDKFKQINDTYGHLAGDEVLRISSGRILELVRKSDTVARMGGDEFVVLLTGLNNAAIAEKIAAKIVEKLAVPVSFAGTEVPVSVSVGVCTGFDADLDADTLLKNADTALYQAKACGRNRFQIFAPETVSTGAE